MDGWIDSFHSGWIDNLLFLSKKGRETFSFTLMSLAFRLFCISNVELRAKVRQKSKFF